MTQKKSGDGLPLWNVPCFFFFNTMLFGETCLNSYCAFPTTILLIVFVYQHGTTGHAFLTVVGILLLRGLSWAVTF